MTPKELLDGVVRPTLGWLGPPYDSQAAEVMLLAIAQQESSLRDRRQTPTGPARSFWQIEPPTLKLVLAKWPEAMIALNDLRLEPEISALWLAYNDMAACMIARGLLWLDKAPLPPIGDRDAAWACYAERCWRPGAPRPEHWPASYAAAIEAVG